MPEGVTAPCYRRCWRTSVSWCALSDIVRWTVWSGRKPARRYHSGVWRPDILSGYFRSVPVSPCYPVGFASGISQSCPVGSVRLIVTDKKLGRCILLRWWKLRMPLLWYLPTGCRQIRRKDTFGVFCGKRYGHVLRRMVRSGIMSGECRREGAEIGELPPLLFHSCKANAHGRGRILWFRDKRRLYLCQVIWSDVSCFKSCIN